RKEVADAIAYLRAIVNPSDEVALRRIINYPTRGIGRTTVLRIVERAQQSRAGFASALRKATADELGTAAHNAIGAFLAMMDAARTELREAEREAQNPPLDGGMTPLARWAEAFLQRLRIEEAIRSDPRNARSADARVDNLRDLVGSIARYERRTWAAAAELASTEAPDDAGTDEDDEAWAPPSMAEALARITLAEMEDRDEEEEDDASVALLTLHSAKGLEFSDVYIVGLEEEILPHARSLADAADPERSGTDPLAEERRLFYVGITRARRRLTLSLCRGRRRGGEVIPSLPSRYLDEIPEELLNVKTAESILSPEESEELKKNFFAQMKEMLGGEG
ncbi:MAG TPA: ATP-dependent helicase, partial [Brevibacterium sp.]|nr:ATP-dependent helicase [Brevibacterium sp.]